MSKIIFKSDAIRVQWSNTLPNNFNETSYFNTTVSNDGTNIILTNPNDPNFVDVEVLYADIVNPVSGSITELEDLIRCEILTHTNRMIHFPESNDIVPAPCLGLQNVGNTLYWNGDPIGGGGASITTADNGLTQNVPGNVRLGGTLVINTLVNAATFGLNIANTSNTSQLNLNNGTTTLRASTNLQIQTPNVSASTSRAGRILTLVNAATGQSEFNSFQNRQNISTYYTQRWINGGATVIPRATGGIVSYNASNITGSTAGLPSTTITLTVGAGSYVGVGVNITGTGIPAGTFIVSQTTGTAGLTGDYVVNNVSTVVAATPVAISGGVTGQINGTSVFSATSQNFVAATNDYLLGAGSPNGAFFTFNTITTPPNYDAVHTISATVITSADCVLTLIPLIDYSAFVVRNSGNALGQISNIAGIGYDQATVCLAGVPTKVYCERFVKANQNIGVTMYRNTNGVNDNTSISFTTRDLTYTFNQI
jgi:hypothetical protein